MAFVLRVGQLGPADIIEARCLCGGGPWQFTRAELVEKHGPHEFARWVFECLRCRRCGARHGITWQTMREEPPG